MCKQGKILNPRTGRCVRADRPLGKSILAMARANDANAALAAKNLTSKIFTKARAGNLSQQHAEAVTIIKALQAALGRTQAELAECNAKLARSKNRENRLSKALLNV